VGTNSSVRKLAAVAPSEEPDACETYASPPAAAPSCPRCFGTGYEVVQGRGARRCPCREQSTQSKLVEAARIPRRYDNCTLQSFFPAPNSGSQLLAFNYAFRLVREYPRSGACRC
jgi:hypothetical protein